MEVISAVSPQRFPHSALISSNNVSQTFQLLRKRWGAEGKGARGGGGGEFVPFAAALSHHQSFFSRRRLVEEKKKNAK